MQDLPRFQVLAATRSEEVVELSGLFNQIASMKEGHCALLVPGSDILIASSVSSDSKTLLRERRFLKPPMYPSPRLSG